MNVARLIAELHKERSRLDEAISDLERILLTGSARRDGPVGVAKLTRVSTPRKRGEDNRSMNAAPSSRPQD